MRCGVLSGFGEQGDVNEGAVTLELGVEDLTEEGCVGGGDGGGRWCGWGDEGVQVWKVSVQDVGGAGEEGEGFGVRGYEGVGAGNCKAPGSC